MDEHTQFFMLLDHEIAAAQHTARILEQRERQVEGTPEAADVGEDVAQAYGRLQGLRHARLIALYGPNWEQHTR